MHYLGSRGYTWVFEGDIKACFDELSHSAILERLRRRVGDKRVVALVRSFLKAGVMSSGGQLRDSATGTPQGSLCSAEHKDLNAQCWLMRSASPSWLVRAGSASGHCA